MNRFKPITKKLNFDKDKRIFRIIFMLNKLNDGNLNIDDMCLEFNTTKRTIYRDLSLIRICGFHIESLGNGNYCFSEGISLKDRDISDEQLASLMLLYEVSEPTPKNCVKGLFIYYP